MLSPRSLAALNRRPWTEAEDAAVLAAENLAFIAAATGRTVSACQSRRFFLRHGRRQHYAIERDAPPPNVPNIPPLARRALKALGMRASHSGDSVYRLDGRTVTLRELVVAANAIGAGLHYPGLLDHPRARSVPSVVIEI